MMYMSGNTLQIFSIMMVFMLFKGPIQGLFSVNAAFAKYDTPTTRGRLLGVKAVYVLMQLALLALGIWKVNAMGLLPYVSPGPLLRPNVQELTEIAGQQDRIGWPGKRSVRLWSELTLPSSELRGCFEYCNIRIMALANSQCSGLHISNVMHFQRCLFESLVLAIHVIVIINPLQFFTS